ncbi:MAG: Gfo/Idh/MocA family oxidoreductase [Chloroflexi bacterium]|nr:Gfo/Idh/MocA family oxidoreductase [Chloroflexota bacterium]OJV94604.1 MAG: oxidoreductase [Chloroflexi bacterium 54-19]
MTGKSLGIAQVGTGAIALANHLPGVQVASHGEMVALCDVNQAALQQAFTATGIEKVYTDYRRMLQDPAVDAVIIATPNIFHKEIALAAIAAGKHVMCEKPLALNYADALEMQQAADKAGVRHMTAFTYRFVPAMRYMRHLIQSGYIGQPYHFRVNRLQDWGDRYMAWRQSMAMAGSGELGDMLSHRVDYGHFLIGPIARLVASTKHLISTRYDGAGNAYPSDVDDWVAVLAEFESGVTGNLESSKLAAGRGEGGKAQDYCEVNGSEGTLIYYLGQPNTLQIGKRGGQLETVAVPEEFLKVPGSPRDPHQGDPVQVFRYDQDFEFIQAIVEGRPCQPSFLDGVLVQGVMDAIQLSDREKRWVDVPKLSAN